MSPAVDAMLHAPLPRRPLFSCTECTECPAGKYAPQACTDANTNHCEPHTTCSAKEWTASDATPWADASCKACTECGDGEYVAKKCGVSFTLLIFLLLFFFFPASSYFLLVFQFVLGSGNHLPLCSMLCSLSIHFVHWLSTVGVHSCINYHWAAGPMQMERK